MNKNKTIGALLAATLMVNSMPFVFADSSKVVTMAADLTPQQQEAILKYFGVNDKNEVEIVDVNNQDERHYLEGVASEAQIGRKTYSCCYIEPTESGKGVNVRTANLTYVTASMISSTLITAGVKDANVLAAAPFKVSGTGALTGCFKAFEQATGEKLDEDKKELATEEIVTTGKLGDQYSPEVAAGMVNDMKADVIKNGTSDKTQIAETINNISNNYNIKLTDDNKQELEVLLAKIAEQDYKYKELEASLNHVAEGVSQQLDELGIDAKTSAPSGIIYNIKNFFVNIFDYKELEASLNHVAEGVSQQLDELGIDAKTSAPSGIIYNIKNFFVNIFDGKDDLGILEQTNDKALGASVVIDSTEEALRPVVDEVKESGIWEKIKGWFQSLFGKDEGKSIENLDQDGDIKGEPKVTTDNSNDQFNKEANPNDEADTSGDPYVQEGDFGDYPEEPVDYGEKEYHEPGEF